MRSVSIVGCLVWISVAGCSESHGLIDVLDDGGPARDAGAMADGGGCTGGPLSCVFESGHVCGDAFATATCEGGAWVCPAGSSASAVCWCWGNEIHGADCTCGPAGWDCPPSECPADPTAAEGTPCATEGQSCGACGDPCGWCNVLTCTGHRWARLEAPPPPPGTCESFSCGPDLLCVRGDQYCAHTLSDVGGVPDDYRCAAFPTGCATADCACFASAGPSCADDGAGAIVLTGGGA